MLIKESKDYILYKGVNDEVFLSILNDGFIKASDEFNNPMRRNITTKNVISATRNKNYAFQVGRIVLVLNTTKISENFKIIPFCENPDYYLDLKKMNNLNTETDNDIKKILRFKEYNDIYWKIKTDTNHDDYGIDEELIVADKLDITKYISYVYVETYSKYIINKYTSDTYIEIKRRLDKLGIENNIILK